MPTEHMMKFGVKVSDGTRVRRPPSQRSSEVSQFYRQQR